MALEKRWRTLTSQLVKAASSFLPAIDEPVLGFKRRIG